MWRKYKSWEIYPIKQQHITKENYYYHVNCHKVSWIRENGKKKSETSISV